MSDVTKGLSRKDVVLWPSNRRVLLFPSPSHVLSHTKRLRDI
jgi:hypothetical protein